MPGIATQGDSSSGHGAFPPRTGVSTITNVLVNGKPPHVHGDAFAVHSDGTSAHGGTAVASSSSVFINGKAVVRIGDSVSCGGVIVGSSGNVFSK